MSERYSSRRQSAFCSIAAVFLNKRPLGRAILIATFALQLFQDFIKRRRFSPHGFRFVDQRQNRRLAPHLKHPPLPSSLSIEVKPDNETGPAQAVSYFKGFFDATI